jgi:hypothetical protein
MYKNIHPPKLPSDLEMVITNIDNDKIMNVEINSTNQQLETFHDSLIKNNKNCPVYNKYKSRILSEIDKYVNNDMIREFNININTNINSWVLYDNNESDINIDNSIKTNEPFNRNEKKYLNVFNERSIFSTETCEWLIKEANNQVKELYGEWKNDRHKRYPTYDISIDNLKKPVMNYILNYFMKKIGPLIYNIFNISTENDLSIKEAFIVKYEEGKQTSLDFHTDDSDISAIILLSDENSFMGGGTQFETGLNVYPNQGDMIVFGSAYKHKGIEIKSGVRMILTFFINVTKK